MEKKYVKNPQSYGFCIIDPDDNVLIVTEVNTWKGVRVMGKKGFPKGHMEDVDKKNGWNCAVRELKEELGIDLNKLNYTLIGMCVGTCTIYVIRIKEYSAELELRVKDDNELINAKWMPCFDLAMAYNQVTHNNSIKIFIEEININLIKKKVHIPRNIDPVDAIAVINGKSFNKKKVIVQETLSEQTTTNAKELSEQISTYKTVTKEFSTDENGFVTITKKRVNVMLKYEFMTN